MSGDVDCTFPAGVDACLRCNAPPVVMWYAGGKILLPYCDEHNPSKAAPAMPTWMRGKPSSVGTWLVELTTKDKVVAEIEPDTDDDGKPYLRSRVDGDSWPLDDPKGELSLFAARSYGPIPFTPRPDAGPRGRRWANETDTRS